jgi:hypothetical protein
MRLATLGVVLAISISSSRADNMSATAAPELFAVIDSLVASPPRDHAAVERLLGTRPGTAQRS